MNILVISPHHDDEVVGCGGTIAKHHKKGDKIWTVYLTAGWSGIPKMTTLEAIKARENEARNACKILGAENPIFMREKDRDFSETGKTIQKLIKIIRKIKPTFIYTPHLNEKDAEHRIAYRITKEASWLSQSAYLPQLGAPTHIQNLLLYEVWTPMSNYLIKEDITDVIDLKKEALAAYKSQTLYLDLLDAAIGLNTYRGSMGSTNKKFAEVFQVEKP